MCILSGALAKSTINFYIITIINMIIDQATLEIHLISMILNVSSGQP